MNEKSDDDMLTEAARMMRRHTDAGWTAMRPGLLDRARRAFRPSAAVRGRHEFGDFFVRADLLVSQLRVAVDAVDGARTADVICATGDDNVLTEVTVQIAADFGSYLPGLAIAVHAAAYATVTGLLGELAPPASAVRTHVHIGDITAP